MPSIGENHTVVCTRQGQVFTLNFGLSSSGHDQLGHRDLQPRDDDAPDHNEPIDCCMPRLVDELVGTRVVFIAAGSSFEDGSGHTAVLVCTDTGRLYTFGLGYSGQLGHGVSQGEWMPRVVEGLIGTKVVGVDAGDR